MHVCPLCDRTVFLLQFGWQIATMAKRKNQRIRMQTAAATFEFQFKLGKQRVREK